MNDKVSILAEFSERLLAIENFKKLTNLLIESVTKATKPQYASIMIFDTFSLELLVEKRRGFFQKRSIPPTIEFCDDMKECRSHYGSMFVMPGSETARFLSYFDSEEPHTCELRVPFSLCANYLGIINLGKKQASQEYSQQELDYLQVLTNYVSISTFKSRLCPAQVAAGTHKNSFACSSSMCYSGQNYSIKPQVRGFRGQEKFGLIGESPAMDRIRDIISKVAGEDVPVLITGESGTGKELIAHAIHAGSQRTAKPLVAMNCAALPDALVESELFGHEKGAFTGAIDQKKGKFEFADESTLFLDEIGDMSLAAQAKLLRVLHDGTFYRVGGNSSLTSNVRIIAATNKDLLEMSTERAFREDLYYRLNVVQIEAPPLRERGEDILLLADYFFNYYNRHYKKELSGFNDEAMTWMLNYDFPGNVRELKNIIERAIIMERGVQITPASFPNHKLNRKPMRSNGQSELRQLERDHIAEVMQEVNHNKSEAARRLGIARKTLREKMQRYQIYSI
jgi:two-component system, NtrC family, response regulator HydG